MSDVNSRTPKNWKMSAELSECQVFSTKSNAISPGFYTRIYRFLVYQLPSSGTWNAHINLDFTNEQRGSCSFKSFLNFENRIIIGDFVRF